MRSLPIEARGPAGLASLFQLMAPKFQRPRSARVVASVSATPTLTRPTRACARARASAAPTGTNGGERRRPDGLNQIAGVEVRTRSCRPARSTHSPTPPRIGGKGGERAYRSRFGKDWSGTPKRPFITSAKYASTQTPRDAEGGRSPKTGGFLRADRVPTGTPGKTLVSAPSRHSRFGYAYFRCASMKTSASFCASCVASSSCSR